MNTVLAQELTNDPLGIGYARMDDLAVVYALNAPTRKRIVTRHASWRTLVSILDDKEYAAVKMYVRSIASQSPRFADAVRYLDMPGDEQGTGGGLDFGHPAIRELIQQAPIPESAKATLLGLSEQPISRAEELGLGTVTLADVNAVREGR